ncbi:MAG: helix-turn-helix transcriptional regulator [Hungatella sp.]|nr:helix-turn-helix transcriptional regulator [Hungatella sp.]
MIEHYGISRGMLDNLKHNRSITLKTLNELCKKFDCDITDIIRYTKDN